MTFKLTPDFRKIETINKAGSFDQKFMEDTRWHVNLYMKFRRNFLRYYFIRPPLWKIYLRSILPVRRMTPTFASLGAVRSGTSLVSDYIMQHPCVVLPLAKEIGIRIPLMKPIMAQFPTVKAEKRIQRKFGRAVTGYCAPMVP